MRTLKETFKVLFWVFFAMLQMATAQKQEDRVIAHGDNYAKAYIDSLETLYNQRIKAGQIDSLTFFILQELSAKYGQTKPEKGLSLADEGIRLASEFGFETQVAHFFATKGLIYRNRGYHDLSLKSYTRTLEIMQRNKIDDAVQFTYIDIGNIYYDQQDFVNAMAYYEKAAKSAKDKNNPRSLVVAYNNMAIVHRQKGEFDKAIEYFNKGMELREYMEDYGLVGHSALYIANVLIRTQAYAEAERYAQRAADSLLKYKYWNALSWSYVAMGRIQYALKNSTKGDTYFQQAINTLEKYNFIPEINEVVIIHAKEKLSLGQHATAVQMLKKALKLAEDTENLLLARNASSYLYEHFKSTGNSREALYYHEKLINIEKTTRDQEVVRKLADMELKYQLSNKESELQISRQNLNKQQVQLEAIKIRNRYLLVGSALIVLILIWLISTLIQKNKSTRSLLEKNKIIAEQKEEIEKNLVELQRAKLEAEKLLKLKSDFLSQMSHEIRTPMNSILGLTNILLDDVKDEAAEDKLQSIKYATEILLVIINDILDLAIIEEGKIKLNRLPVNLKRLFTELEKNLSLKAREKNIQLVWDIDPDLPNWVLSDDTRLFQILMNLISNAIKFTDEGKVSISCVQKKASEQHVRLKFKIKDTGIGIAPEKQKVIFESFHQGSRDIQRNYGGTGLGLTITRRLLELFDSEIKLKSTPGVGSEFSFELMFDVADSPLRPLTSKQDAKQYDLQGLYLLYVEDNDMNQKVMSLLLGRAGVQLDFAKNGQEAMVLLIQNKYDGVLMDFHMPVMDGLSCTRAIRVGSAGPENLLIPIIGVTADVFEESTKEGQLSGMNAIVKKPINKDELFSCIVTHCRATVKAH